MLIREYNFTNRNQISAIYVDNEYLWIAYEDGGSVYLDKVSVFNPNLRYFNLTLTVDKVNRIKASGDYIYLAVEDTDYIGIKIKKLNPIVDTDYIDKPDSINEHSVDLCLDTTYLYLLIPGEESGEYTKILKYNKSSLALSETIELSESGDEVNNAKSMTIDDSDNIWIVTYEDPVKLIKLYEESSGYVYETWDIQ